MQPALLVALLGLLAGQLASLPALLSSPALPLSALVPQLSFPAPLRTFLVLPLPFHAPLLSSPILLLSYLAPGALYCRMRLEVDLLADNRDSPLQLVPLELGLLKEDVLCLDQVVEALA
jgi:hypothetical protein